MCYNAVVRIEMVVTILNGRKEIALNKLFNTSIVLGVFSVCVSVELFSYDKIIWGVICAILASLLLVLPMIFTPCCYIFDSEGVSFCYILIPNERFLWKDVYAVEVEDINPPYSHTYSITLDFFYASVFCLKCSDSIKRRFFENVHIRKSFRTKKLLRKYWDGTITGYFFDDAKKWIKKKRAKKQAYVNAHFSDAIIKMEREIRADAREWLKPVLAQAKQNDLDVKMRYYYVTEDSSELKSRPRPEEGYTYFVDVEISHYNETDENKIIVVSADLLYVKFGKTAYRGIKNPKAKEELQIDFSDVLEKIN